MLTDPSFELAEPEVYYVEHNESDYIAFYFTNFNDDFVYIYSCEGELVCQDTYSNYCEIWVEYDKKVLLSP